MMHKDAHLKDATIVVHHRRLTSEGVVGWCYQDGDEFTIEIERSLSRAEYITTLIHELVHVRQTLTGNTCDIEREREAYILEHIYSNDFND
jgi:hypothetical protein